jgi:predicted dehydrogenase
MSQTMTSKTLNIGLIGCGFSGRLHSNAYKRVNDFFELAYRPVLQAVCGRNAERTRAFADRWGYASVETDWRKLIERPDIEVVDVCTPNHTHAEIAVAAAQAGKFVLCESPLATNSVDGEAMCKAVEKAGVPNLVWFNYRRAPAVTLAKRLIDDGWLGRVFHYRAQFLQDWTLAPDLPGEQTASLRSDVAAAGSGVTGDLLSHCIDTAIWLNGGMANVTALTETLLTVRQHTLTGEVEPVEVDDASAFLCRFHNGSLGNFESTRFACGHKSLYTWEVNGQRASLKWDLQDLHRLQYFDHRDDPLVRGWRSIQVTDSDMPYMDKWWAPGLQIGFEHTYIHQAADFLDDLAQHRLTSPTFREALETQKVCDAVLASAKSGQWIDVR